MWSMWQMWSMWGTRQNLGINMGNEMNLSHPSANHIDHICHIDHILLMQRSDASRLINLDTTLIKVKACFRDSCYTYF